jgi:Protein of unknown function (DUF3306)
MKKAVLLAAAPTLAPPPTRSQEAQRTGGREPSIEEPSRFYGPAPGSQPAVDVTALPSIGSLAADIDIRALLQPGAQAELTMVAPRRAWAIDSAIRDFIGIAENEWDFTDTTGIPGFGPLEATDEIGRVVARPTDKCGRTSHLAISEPIMWAHSGGT